MLLIARKLSSRNISFMYQADGNEEAITLEEALWATWKGFLIFSPTPADYLPMAIPQTADPLDETSWKLLRELNQISTGDRKLVAKNLHMTLASVNWRINHKIKPILASIIFGKETAEKMGYFLPTKPGIGELGNQENSQQNYDQQDNEDNDAAFTDKTLIGWYKENRVKYCPE